MTTPRKAAQPVPASLDDHGKALWRSITKKYRLRPDELLILEAACKGADRIAQMEVERAGRWIAKGSMGQEVIHPLVAEIRMQESQNAALLARLKLPDLPDVAASGGAGENPRSTQARKAAQSRWAAAHGA